MSELGGNAGFAGRAAVGLVRLYQRWISPVTGAHCRFAPTCSSYAIVSIQRRGLRVGGWLALRRLARCHPFHSGGFDPVPRIRMDRGVRP